MYHDHYYYFMTDPFMNVLFDFSKEALDNKHHGTRFALYMMQFFGDDDKYQKTYGTEMIDNLNASHTKAKACPLRGKYKGKQFTTN